MSSRSLLLLAGALAFASAAKFSSFDAWATTFGKSYAHDERVHRLSVWAANDEKITAHNAGNATYKLGHNQFSDLTGTEWKALISRPMAQRHASGTAVHRYGGEPLAGAMDWTTKGAVTPVKNQAQCGSCWAFSTTGSLEGAYFLKNNKLVSFSEQNLVSCDTVDHGCNGGLMDNAFGWEKANGGLCKESDYPYTSAKGTVAPCAKNCTAVAGSAASGHVDVDQSDDALASALATGPVSVAIEADQQSFQLYASGVITGLCGTNLDHGVLAVGYGTTAGGTAYFKVKNSWDTTWGMDGYVLLERNNPQDGGQCGIHKSASYPTL
eukprot:g2747.t1